MPIIRSFIALPTNDSIKQQIAKIQDELKQVSADVKWESHEKFHMTLKFLGNVEIQRLDQLALQLESYVSTVKSFDLVYQHVGGFPDLNSPRVIWIGTAENDSLNNLQKKIEEVCAQYDFLKEERAFHPHITLGRVKGKKNLNRLTEKIKSITLEPLHSPCIEVLLMRSELQPTGSVYSILKSIPFKM